MATNWSNYIEDRVCQPIDDALYGNDPGIDADFNKLNLSGTIWYIKDKNGQGKLLAYLLGPYIEEYLFHPQERMCDEYVSDETMPSFWESRATATLRDLANSMFSAKSLLAGRDIIKVINDWTDDYYKGFRRIEFHFGLLIKAVQEGWTAKWEEIRDNVTSELVNSPSDYDKIRLEYFCYLDAVIKITTCNDITDEQRAEWFTKLRAQWSMLALIYSVMTGHIIHTGYNNFSSVIGQFKVGKKEYASLMVAALRHHPQVLGEGRSRQIARDVANTMRTIKQNTELHGLCACLFPSKHWDEYDLNAPRMSTAEMWSRIEYLEGELNSSNNREQDQQKLEQTAEYLKSQLGNAISMDDLANAILKCPPVMANLIFTQLDLRLEDVSEVWTRNRKDLKRRVLALEKADSNVLNDTFAKVAAIEDKPYTVNHNYGNGAIHEDRSRNLLLSGNTASVNMPLLLDSKD